MKSVEILGTQKEQEERPNEAVPGRLVHDRKKARVRVVPANLAV